MNKNIFKVSPIYLEKIWGGENLQDIYKYESSLYNLGEVWIFSAIDSGDCFVEASEGLVSLSDFFTNNYNKLGIEEGEQPKIQMRLVDCKEDLSLQVHPNDEMSQNMGELNGKDETWLVLKTDYNSKLIMGCSEEAALDFKNGGEVNELYKTSIEYNTCVGDVFHVSAGVIHALGKNNFVLEISQPSNTTFRVFDYNRKDINGEYRDLHLLESREACNPVEKNTDIVTHIKYTNGNKVKKTKIKDLYSFEQVNIIEEFSFRCVDKYAVIYIQDGEIISINNSPVKKVKLILLLLSQK